MANLKLQRRLAAAVLKCGKNRVFLDPEATAELVTAVSRRSIRRLKQAGTIVRKPVKGQSRARCRAYLEAKRRGRHMGLGKRQGTANARNPRKRMWMKRQRVLRRLLKKYREEKKIDRHMYHVFYFKAKGNQFKNKKVMLEAIWNAQNEQNKAKQLAEQQEARKLKIAAKKEKAANKAAAAAPPAQTPAAETTA
eukprot:Protomagalhaensia_sp_Gyna_25__605@NODE_1286_length_1980_cov_703_193199_g349_i2_p2_GENE_NODE_1286_length_1980_cov_703_193199_g349_i2NODE_1286_length_1980_cov_703_193199_g349_i2_p2_ORF_typecomplete_len194_score57_84Ribosomal_L19e/PF01280_20/9_6e61Ribosomal_L19e/PF01280_20/7e02RE_AccI/PF09545_10/0_0018Pox_F15/PF04596_12/0_13Pex2_Pex12/PF04757_14/0_11_NODE_1286_length_1980_cov_703_193199_g349_i2106687